MRNTASTTGMDDGEPTSNHWPMWLRPNRRPSAISHSRAAKKSRSVAVSWVDQLVPVSEWNGRYDEINALEKKISDEGTTNIKCFLHVSFEEQKARLADRLKSPEK